MLPRSLHHRLTGYAPKHAVRLISVSHLALCLFTIPISCPNAALQTSTLTIQPKECKCLPNPPRRQERITDSNTIDTAPTERTRPNPLPPSSSSAIRPIFLTTFLHTQFPETHTVGFLGAGRHDSSLDLLGVEMRDLGASPLKILAISSSVSPRVSTYRKMAKRSSMKIQTCVVRWRQRQRFLIVKRYSMGGWKGSAYSVDGVELLVWLEMRESQRIDVLVHSQGGLDEEIR